MIINKPALPCSSSLFCSWRHNISRCFCRGDNCDYDEKLGAQDKLKRLMTTIFLCCWCAVFSSCPTSLTSSKKDWKSNFNIWSLVEFVLRAKHVALAAVCCSQPNYRAKPPHDTSISELALTLSFTAAAAGVWLSPCRTDDLNKLEKCLGAICCWRRHLLR